MNKCVFLDRDGTINVHIPYLSDSESFVLLEGVGEAIKRLNENNYLVIVVTNQSGISRGYITGDELDKIHLRMHELLEEYHAKIDAVYFCTSLPDDNDYNRKPNPGMLVQAISEYNIDTSKSFMIGDRATDILAGIKANLNSILLPDHLSQESSTYGLRNEANLIEDKSDLYQFSESLYEAVDKIILNGNK